jgi:hypothetical protein
MFDRKYFFLNKKSVVILILLLIISTYNQKIIYEKTVLISSCYNSSNSSNEITWSELYRVSNAVSGAATDSDITIDKQGNIHVVWGEEIGGYTEILYRKFTKTNNLWTPTEIVSNTTAKTFSAFPVIAVDGDDKLHVLWRETNETHWYMVYRRTNGLYWDIEEQLANVTVFTAHHDIISWDNGTVYAIWNDRLGLNFELFYKTYSTTNNSWSNITQHTNSTYGSLSPKVVVDNQDNIHLTWTDSKDGLGTTEVFYQWFDGVNWFPQIPLIISSIEDGLDTNSPNIAFDKSNKLYFLWENNEVYNKIQLRSYGNDSLSEIFVVSGNGSAHDPEMFVDSIGNLHIVWIESLAPHYQRLQNSTSYHNILPIPSKFSFHLEPEIVIDKNELIHIIWSGYSSEDSWEIYYIHSVLVKESLENLILSIVFPFIGFIIVAFIIIKRFWNSKRNYEHKI